MAALMAEDKFISVERAMELGMVGEVIAPISAKRVNNMSIKEKILNAINNVFGTEEPAPMMAMELATASGDTLRIEREEGAPAVGDVAEPDGEWLMPDNTTIVVENGVITEIRQPEEEAEVVDEGGEQEGDATAEETDGEQSELEKENEALKERIAELEQQLAELTERLAEANANAKTTEDLRILNMVTMGGGYEKVAASIKSNYTPEKREPVTSKAEAVAQRNFLKERIEAARNKNNK
jgi:ATP-dependent Clp protease protease subunit